MELSLLTGNGEELFGERHVLTVCEQDEGQRLDRFIASKLPAVSRVRIQELIHAGHVLIDNAAEFRPSLRLRGKPTITVQLGQRPSPDLQPEAIPLDIVYDDPDLVVVNKPAGLAVHAGAGRRSGTLVNALLHRFGTLSGAGGADRPGIVHRLDRLTSGLLVVARNDWAHRELARQFQVRDVKKIYTAVVHGAVQPDRGEITLPISRDLRHRARMTTRRASGRSANSEFVVVERWTASNVKARFRLAYSRLKVRILTGRTHQIRVHLSSIGHPIVGDRSYGAPAVLNGPGVLTGFVPDRYFLHAGELSFVHPRTMERLTFTAALPFEMSNFVQMLRKELGSSGKR